LSLKFSEITDFHRAFHRFGQTKFPDGGLALGLSQFSILPKLHQKTMLALKGVKIDSKISNSSRESKSATPSVQLLETLKEILSILS